MKEETQEESEQESSEERPAKKKIRIEFGSKIFWRKSDYLLYVSTLDEGSILLVVPASSYPSRRPSSNPKRRMDSLAKPVRPLLRRPESGRRGWKDTGKTSSYGRRFGKLRGLSARLCEIVLLSGE